MDAKILDEQLSVAKLAARIGGRLALDMHARREELDIVDKGLHDRATEADRDVELAIREIICGRFPKSSILGEELDAGSEIGSEDDLWVIDPIDGTDCFLFGLPMWSVSIAWVHQGIVKVGVVFDPIHDEMFSAAMNCGTTVNGKSISASRAETLEVGLTGIGHSTRVPGEETLSAMRRLIERKGMFHRCGSGALSLAWVAAGRLIAFYESHMNSWDCLAGLLLIREAGGWHSDFLQGAGLQKGNPVLASGPHLIKDIKAIAGD